MENIDIKSIEDAWKAKDTQILPFLKEQWGCSTLLFEGTFSKYTEEAKEKTGAIGEITNITCQGNKVAFPMVNIAFNNLLVKIEFPLTPGQYTFSVGLASKQDRLKANNPFLLKVFKMYLKKDTDHVKVQKLSTKINIPKAPQESPKQKKIEEALEDAYKNKLTLNGFVKSIEQDELIVDFRGQKITIAIAECDFSPESVLHKVIKFHIKSIRHGHTPQYYGSCKNIVREKIRKILSQFTLGCYVKTLISNVDDDSITVNIDNEIDVVVKSIPSEYAGNLHEHFAVGDMVCLKVKYLDKNKPSISLVLTTDHKERIDIREEKERASHFVQDCLPQKDTYESTIIGFSSNIVSIIVDDYYYGYIPKTEISVNTVRNIGDVLFKGEIRKAKFKSVQDGRLIFSLKDLENDCYPKELYNATLFDLLVTMNVHNNHFIAQLSHNTKNNDIAALNLYADQDGGELLANPYTGKNIVAVNKNDTFTSFENGQYYEIELIPPVAEDVTDTVKNPYLFSFNILNETPVCNPYERAVSKNFKKFSDPKSNLSLAGLLDEVGMNMYSSRKRMFFELLQNADDASALNGVQMKVAVLDNYLIITHNGFAFNRNDFEAITSASNSNKKHSSQKTGYKGIGFKSVFTNSQKVYIKSGGFFFVFDKESSLFNDFKSFYFNVRKLETIESQEEFMDDYRLEYQNFDRKKHIPWHLLPLWCDTIPEEIFNTIFRPGSANVAIALNMDEVSTEDYRKIILDILQNPRFMLFLRNTKRIQYLDEFQNTISIGKVAKNNTVTLKNSFLEEDRSSDFLVDEEVGITSITDEKLTEGNEPFRRVRDGERVYFVEDTEKGPRELDSIPERIAASDDTKISFAIPLDKEGHYIVGSGKENSLYAYLPMNDMRFRFPFYINGDFVLSSDREGVKDENLWNQFLFKKIGEILPVWVSKLASTNQKDYLNLLLDATMDEEVEGTQHLTAKFNKAYTSSLCSTSFVLNHKGELSKLEEIIVDKSGLSKVIGEDLFCLLIGTDKVLPHPNCCSDLLSSELIKSFGLVEYVKSDLVISQLSKPQNLKYIRHWFELATPDKREKAFKWILKKYNHSSTEARYYLLENMPTIKVGRHFRTLSEIQNNPNIVLCNETFKDVATLIEQLGCKCSEDVTEHEISKVVLDKKAWRDYNIKTFSFIKRRTAVTPININDRYSLFAHFAKKEIMALMHANDCELTSWALFSNSTGDIKPLQDLIHINQEKYKGLLSDYIFSEEEYRENVVTNYIMPGREYYNKIVYKNWGSLCSKVTSSDNAILLYNLATTTYNQAELEKQTVKSLTNARGIDEYSVVWVDTTFKNRSECFINSLASRKEEFRSVIEKITSLSIPDTNIIEALQQKPFSLKDQSICNLTLSSNIGLSLEETKNLLEYCKRGEESLFSKYYITKTEDKFYLSSLEKGSIVAYSSDEDVTKLITEEITSIHLLPSELSEYRYLADVFKGDQLKKEMISRKDRYEITENSFASQEDSVFRWIKVASSINEGYRETFVEMGKKLHYTISTTESYKVTSLKLQQDVTLGGKKYPLSELKPSDDLVVRSINILIERLRANGIKAYAINVLFNLTEDEGLAQSIFTEINKTGRVIQNGTQLAFVLNYGAKNNISILNCKLSGDKRISGIVWYSEVFDFIKSDNVLPEQYKDVLKYIDVPYSSVTPKFSIIKSVNDYSHISETLSEAQQKSLLDYIFKKWEADNNNQLNDVNRNYVNRALNIDTVKQILSEKYVLQEEQVPSILKNWLNADSETKNKKVLFVKDVLSLKDDDCDAIRIRKYIQGVLDVLPTSVSEQKEVTAKTLNWIVGNTIKLEFEQYETLNSILTAGSFVDSVDVEKIQKRITHQAPVYKTDRVSYYSYNGQMPHIVTIPKKDDYVCLTYNKGDVSFFDCKIVYNDNSNKDLETIILYDVINKLSGYKLEDYIELQKIIHNEAAKFDTDVDDGLSQERRAAISEAAMDKAKEWLEDNDYDTKEVIAEYSCFSGVKNKEGIEIPIVVKSCQSDERHFELNPYQWQHLMKNNSVLMLYRGDDNLYITTRDELLEGKDRISLTFGIENLDSADRISALARTLAHEYFKSVQFDFGKLRQSQYHVADRLEKYQFNKASFAANSAVSEASDEDINF